MSDERYGEPAGELRVLSPRSAAALLGPGAGGIPSEKTLAIAHDMQEGRWQPAEVVISQGRVLAGATHLQALIEAKVTLPFLVMIRE